MVTVTATLANCWALLSVKVTWQVFNPVERPFALPVFTLNVRVSEPPLGMLPVLTVPFVEAHESQEQVPSMAGVGV